ncbi:MAG: TIGR02646 family protein [Clostridiales bacterium]|nr:TIGR02646 family protein [Clostridiales bacterium]
MIVIKRGKEPDSLLEFRLQNPEADYEDMPSEVRNDIREQMCQEQEHLCGYCMRRIKAFKNVRIEHCKPRHPQGEIEHDKRATLDFKWMIGVCHGNSLVRGVKPEDTTCDAHKGNAELTINPYNEDSIRKIKYKSDGRIYSEDPEIDCDVTETLNLNCEAISLPQTRKNVLMAEKNRIMKKCKGKSQDAFMRELRRTYESLVQERNLTPYCGIIISWLEEKLKIS